MYTLGKQNDHTNSLKMLEILPAPSDWVNVILLAPSDWVNVILPAPSDWVNVISANGKSL